ncbi:hypothetical protein C8R44DRAFT_868559 [Mycena epipterygia]|nr:hypothetical protein C8R44DRAFT_868559 [Mycena epipterygia]
MLHILSSKSKELGRDTFLFIFMNASPARLILGVNQKLILVSSATVQRWIRIISPKTTSDLFICPITVQSVGIFEYCIQTNAPSFDGTLDSLLLPGDYGLYYNRECIGEDSAKCIAEYQFPPDFEQSVIARDKHRCRFTVYGRDDGYGLVLDLPAGIQGPDQTVLVRFPR